MARPDYTGRDISVPPVRRNVTPKPKTPPNGRSTQGVNQTNLKQVKRRKLDRETARLLKDDLMQVMTAEIHITYTKLHTKMHMKPPVHFNRVRYEEHDVSGVSLMVLTPAGQLSDVREDESQQRVHHTLSRLFSELDNDPMLSEGPMFVIFDLDFDNYLNDADSLTKALGRWKRLNSGDRPAGGIMERHEQSSQQNTSSVQFFTDRQSHHNHTTYIFQNPHDLEPDLSVFNRPRDLDPNLQRGRFDILIIHPQKGFMIFKVKATGDAFGLSPYLQSLTGQHDVIRKKLKTALEQLNKEEEVLRYLISDLNAGNIPVTKGLMLPNLKKQTVRLALMQDPILQQKFVGCLKADTLDMALEKCIFSDHLPPMGQSMDTSHDVISNLRCNWWKTLVDQRLNDRMHNTLYEAIIARFCGPATTQLVKTAHSHLADVSTLPQAVLETSHCFSQPVLTQSQVELVRLDHPRVYLTGPSGTGKSVLLMLKARDLAQQGKAVLVTSLWPGSEAATRSLHQQVNQNCPPSRKTPLLVSQSLRLEDMVTEVKEAAGRANSDPTDHSRPQATSDHPMTLNDDDLAMDCPYEETTNHAVRADRSYQYSPTASDTTGQSHHGFTNSDKLTHTPGQNHLGFRKSDKLYLILDEAPWFLNEFIQQLEAKLGKDGFVVWAASSFPCRDPKVDHQASSDPKTRHQTSNDPRAFYQVTMTQSLRLPPVVVRELQATSFYQTYVTHPYTSLDTGVLAGMPSPTDGPPVKRIHHKQHREPAKSVWDCEQCGEEVWTFLVHDLHIGDVKNASEDHGTKQQLNFSDVLISGYNVPRSAEKMFLKCLVSKDVPLVSLSGSEDVEKLARPSTTDSVQVVQPESILGLQRAVVVAMGTSDVRETYPRYVDPWYDVMACCKAQLVLVGEPEISVRELLVSLSLQD
ncbi:uncharacterized protein [Littorina saxatilis]|uniref:Uncharacterized protein n=1 Tax=Littorina saxatilis TaxID=31220 RepID=A0AAN9BGQ6_9CAEN